MLNVDDFNLLFLSLFFVNKQSSRSLSSQNLFHQDIFVPSIMIKASSHVFFQILHKGVIGPRVWAMGSLRLVFDSERLTGYGTIQGDLS